MNIKRYEPTARYIGSGGCTGMHTNVDGDWCRYSDYLQLRAELDAARAENALLRLGAKLLAKLESCPECGRSNVKAVCSVCRHWWEVEW